MVHYLGEAKDKGRQILRLQRDDGQWSARLAEDQVNAHLLVGCQCEVRHIVKGLRQTIYAKVQHLKYHSATRLRPLVYRRSTTVREHVRPGYMIP